MTFCLNKNLVKPFIEKLKSGEINPDKLSKMSSKERRDFFAKHVGEFNAEKTNALFESKLLLKNQKKGLVNWAEKITGLKPETQRDLISRINRMDKILNPVTEKAFLSDLAAQRLNVTVSLSEAAEIASLAKNVSEKKIAIDRSSPHGSNSRVDYGRAMYDFGKYVSDLKNEAKKLSPLELASRPVEMVSKLGGLTKSLKATFDNSAIGRQGFKIIWTNPKFWLKNSAKTFVDIYKVLGGKNAQREVMAEVLSRENSLNGLYKKEKLAIGVVEEAYPESFPEKIPGLGLVFKASESAFTGFQYRSRADLFDNYVTIAEKSGIAEIEGIGKLANSLTGRGDIGRLEASAGVLNNVFFSPRFLKSNIDILTAHAFDKNISAFARKQAAINTIKVIGGTALVLSLTNAINPDSIEDDPTSSDFGKIKVGNTRFDVSGGLGSIFTLAARLATGKSKSSVSGLKSDLNSGKWGSMTKWDVITSFFENKFSPLMSVLKQELEGKTFEGEKPTMASRVAGLFLPIPLETPYEAFKDPDSAPLLLTILADQLGFGANTYSIGTVWDDSGVELGQFKAKVGAKKFEEANDEYNKKLGEWFKEVKTKEDYKKLTDDDKRNVISKRKKEIKKQIFRQYGFKAKKSKKTAIPNL